MALLSAGATRFCRLGTCVVALVAVAAATAAPLLAQTDAELRQSLQRACQARMQLLQAAERENAEAIDWDESAASVRGSYVGYAPDFTCKRTLDGAATPAAQLNYQEIVYEKRGRTARAARQAQPRPTEIRNVTLVLVFQDGAWR